MLPLFCAYLCFFSDSAYKALQSLCACVCVCVHKYTHAPIWITAMASPLLVYITYYILQKEKGFEEDDVSNRIYWEYNYSVVTFW